MVHVVEIQVLVDLVAVDPVVQVVAAERKNVFLAAAAAVAVTPAEAAVPQPLVVQAAVQAVAVAEVILQLPQRQM
jgi:hypothetical protein